MFQSYPLDESCSLSYSLGIKAPVKGLKLRFMLLVRSLGCWWISFSTVQCRLVAVSSCSDNVIFNFLDQWKKPAEFNPSGTMLTPEGWHTQTSVCAQLTDRCAQLRNSLGTRELTGPPWAALLSQDNSRLFQLRSSVSLSQRGYFNSTAASAKFPWHQREGEGAEGGSAEVTPFVLHRIQLYALAARPLLQFDEFRGGSIQVSVLVNFKLKVQLNCYCSQNRASFVIFYSVK